MSDKTQSSPLNEPQLLTTSGPILLRDFNPKAVLRFSGRKCITCNKEILDHWLLPNGDGEYWCDNQGWQFSKGIADGRWEVPEDFGKNLNGTDKK